MSDDALKGQLKRSLQSMQPDRAPDFDTVWSAAQIRHAASRRDYAMVAGFAAAVATVALVAFGLWSSGQRPQPWEFRIAESLMESTRWSAPSDVLLPEYAIDVYSDMPVLLESTDLEDGTLL